MDGVDWGVGGDKARRRHPRRDASKSLCRMQGSADLEPNALGHFAKHKLRDTTEPHAVKTLIVFVGVVGSVAVGVGSEIVQIAPSFLGVDAEVERDVVGATAEQIQKRIGTVDHGKGGPWAGPRGDDGKPSAPVVFFKRERELTFCANQSASLTGELNLEDRRCFVQQVGGRRHGKRGLRGETEVHANSAQERVIPEVDNLVTGR